MKGVFILQKMYKKNNVVKELVLGTLLASCLLLEPTAVLAAEEELEEFTLDPITVTAQRRETRTLDTPASVDVITSERIKELGAQTIFDVLGHTIGISNDSYGPGGMDYGMSMSRNTIRGLDKGTLVLVNGAPLNLLNYNSTDGIPIEAVERIEVIKGASSTLYGSEALAGVINIITKNPGEKTYKNNIQVSGGNYYNNASITSQFDKSTLYIKREWFGSVDRLSRDGVNGPPPGSTSTSWRYAWGRDSSKKDSLYYTTAFNDKLSFNLSLSRNEPERPRYRRATGVINNLYTYDDRRYNFNFVYNDKESELRSIFAFNYRRSRGLNYAYNALGVLTGVTQSNPYDMYSLNSDTQKTWHLRGDKDVLITGVTLAREHYEDPRTGTNHKNALRNTVALYLSYDYKFSNKFSTILGLRAQHSSDYAKNNNAFLPQIQTLYKLNNKTSWFINVGKAHQMPALNQYFSQPGGNFSKLNPQQGWTYETGLKFVYDKQAVKFSVYHMKIKDKFAWDTSGPINFLYNAGDFKNTGVEIEYDRKINSNWRINLGASISNPKINDSGSWVQDSSRLQMVAGVTYTKSKFTGNINYLFIGDREDSAYTVNNYFGPIANKVHLNATLSYKFDENNTLNFNLYNLLDRANSLNKYENLDLPFNWVLSYSHSF